MKDFLKIEDAAAHVWWTDINHLQDIDIEVVCFDEENKCIKGRCRMVRTFCCENF